MKKMNKKIFIIATIIIVIITVILVLLNNKNNDEKLLLSCNGTIEDNMNLNIEIYKKDSNKIYYMTFEQSISELDSEEKQLYKALFEASYKDYENIQGLKLSKSITDDLVKIDIIINSEEASQDEAMREIFGYEDTDIKTLKSNLEGDGLTCKKN